MSKPFATFESANEELTASNEEAMSVNEEFQSANEELQTSKEELQSLNEELTALNNQLQEAVEKQRNTASDLQNILNSSDIATLFLDRDFKIRFFTPAAKSIFGIINSDIGRPLANLALPFTDVNLLDDARLVLANLTPLQREIRTEKGTWYIRRVLPYRSQDDHIQGVVITFTDISEMKAVEVKIRAAQGYAESIINTIREPLIVLDEDWRILSASRSFYRFLDAKPEDTIGRLLRDSDAHHLDVPALGGFIERIQSGTKEVENYQIEIDLPIPGRRTVILSGRELNEQPEGKRHILVTIEDISERVQAEEALVLARRQAEQANLAKSRFLAAASHDLRQPLQTLRLLRGILEQKVTDAEALKLVKRSGETLDAITEMLDSILDINQLEAGTVNPHVVSFPINNLLDRLRREFSVHAQAVNLGWRVVTSSKIVKSDPNLLEQMVRNLISNALKYTTSGKVLLGSRTRGDKLSIEIWDTGTGIPATELKSIFDEFHQTDAQLTPDRGRGLGLGLSIVQRLAGLLGHAIDVRSRIGKGTVFSIEVPIERRPPQVEQTEREIRAGEERSEGRGTILIVEDDASVRETAEMFLNTLGHRAVATASGAAALAWVKGGGQPDIVLADYTLPEGQNGLDVIATMRAVLQRRVPAIVLTGDVSTATLHAIAQRGDPHLTKPVRSERLKDLIGQLLTEPPRRVAPQPTEEVSKLTDEVEPTIFVVDDDAGVRETLQEFLEMSGYQVQTFASGAEFLDAFHPRLSGCLLVDVRMPGMDGIEVLNELKIRGTRLPALVITGRGDIATAVQAMKAGAVDFIEKPIDDGKLLALIGQALTHASATSESSEWRAAAARRMASLTKRQREILDLIVAGHANKEIAARLRISQRTVESHRALIMQKMGAESFAELVRLSLAVTLS